MGSKEPESKEGAEDHIMLEPEATDVSGDQAAEQRSNRRDKGHQQDAKANPSTELHGDGGLQLDE